MFESFEAPDPSTFVINAKGKTPLVIQIVSNGITVIVPKHISAVDPVNTLKETLHTVGSGPFRMVGDIGTTLSTLERNPDYFKPGLPYMDGYEAHLVLDPQARATAVLTQRIFMNNPSSFSLIDWEVARSTAAQDSGIIHEGITSTFLLFLSMNTMKPPLDDLRIRQAISHALDRSDLVTLDPRTGIEGLGTQRGFIGTGLNPNNPTWAMPDDVRQQLVGYGADMEVRRALARDLIADYEADKGPIAPGTFQFQCGTLHVSCEIAVLYQSQLAKVGIDMEITPGDTIEVWFSQVEGNHFMTTFFTTLESDDPGPAMGQQFICTGTHNYHFRCLDELDTIWSAQIFENDESARRQSAWDMNTLAMNDAANLIIYWHLAEHIRRDFIKGWTTRPFQWDAMRASEFMWLDKEEFPEI